MYSDIFSFRFMVGLIIILLAGNCLALATDKDQPVEIEADSVDINESEGTSVYKGKVVINQGSMQLKADTVTVYYEDRKPYKLVAVGKPVRFKQLPDKAKEYVTGKGNRLVYRINSEELTLTDDAELHQGKDSFKSDRIVYDRVNARLKAGAVAKGSERVRVSIQPTR